MTPEEAMERLRASNLPAQNLWRILIEDTLAAWEADRDRLTRLEEALRNIASHDYPHDCTGEARAALDDPTEQEPAGKQ